MCIFGHIIRHLAKLTVTVFHPLPNFHLSSHIRHYVIVVIVDDVVGALEQDYGG